MEAFGANSLFNQLQVFPSEAEQSLEAQEMQRTREAQIPLKSKNNTAHRGTRTE
ncbi:hypothetical protein [Thiolapillus sp.]|uniref:hypothetical protein n=1 Tax=Thiolapillus sp. TaxID=2017437 RepID=UPI003AF9AEF7